MRWTTYRLMKPYPHFTLNHLTVPVTFVAEKWNNKTLKTHLKRNIKENQALFILKRVSSKTPSPTDQYKSVLCQNLHPRSPNTQNLSLFGVGYLIIRSRRFSFNISHKFSEKTHFLCPPSRETEFQPRSYHFLKFMPISVDFTPKFSPEIFLLLL